MSEMHWYALYVVSGLEEQAKRNIEKSIENHDLTDQVAQIVVPKQVQIQIKKGKRTPVETNLFQGYILIQAILDKELMYVIKTTPKVKKFAGTYNNPVPLDDSEVEKLLCRSEKKTKDSIAEIDLMKGEEVKIIDGPFAEFTGIIDDINNEKASLKVLVRIFGRATSVDLKFDQVVKLSELKE